MKIPKWLEIMLIIISPILSILGKTLFTISGANLKVIMIVGLIIISSCYSIICYIKREKTESSKKLKELSKSISKFDDDNLDEKRIKDQQKEQYENIKENIGNYNDNIIKMKGYIKTTIIILAIFYIPRCTPLVTLANNIVGIAIAPFYELSEPAPTPIPTLSPAPTFTPELTPEETVEPTKLLIPEPTVSPTEEQELLKNNDKWVRFILMYPNGYIFNEDEYKELYGLLFYIDIENLDEVVKNYTNIWLLSNKTNSPLNNAFTKQGMNTEYYVNLEKEFSYENTNNLTSEKWDELIEGRKELYELYPNGTLARLLANHYQAYALNYLEQTNDGKSILYFYLKSIQYTQKSLEFSMNNKTKLGRIRYLQARYKDIADCEYIDANICLRASKIYMAIQEALNELEELQQ